MKSGRSLTSTTILPARWSSTISNSPIYPVSHKGVPVNIFQFAGGVIFYFLRWHHGPLQQIHTFESLSGFALQTQTKSNWVRVKHDNTASNLCNQWPLRFPLRRCWHMNRWKQGIFNHVAMNRTSTTTSFRTWFRASNRKKLEQNKLGHIKLWGCFVYKQWWGAKLQLWAGLEEENKQKTTHSRQRKRISRINQKHRWKRASISRLTVLLHNLQELHNDLRAGPNEHLPLPALLSVGDGLKGIGKHRHPYHLRIGRAESQKQ